MGGDAHHVALNIGPGTTRYLDATLGRLREGGFSIEGTPASAHVAEVITEIMRSGREEDFEFGLDLILDGVGRTPQPRLTWSGTARSAHQSLEEAI